MLDKRKIAIMAIDDKLPWLNHCQGVRVIGLNKYLRNMEFHLNPNLKSEKLKIKNTISKIGNKTFISLFFCIILMQKNKQNIG